MIHVAAYTPGRHVPSARFRVRQLVEPLATHGVALREFPATFGAYPPEQRLLRPGWGALALGERTLSALRSHAFDVTLLQREMLSTLVTAEHVTRRPRILDVDDAIWLHAPARIAALAKEVELIVCGNHYIAEWFSQVNPRTRVIPTGVDIERYTPGTATPASNTIGWCGTSSGHPYLLSWERALARVLDVVPTARLRVISDRRPRFERVPGDRVDYVTWSPDIEVAALQDLSVGIMPLPDTAWARGKCSFKMLTYMACSVPVVASDVGMNADVFRRGTFGVPVRCERECVDALIELLRDTGLQRRMGPEGRRVIEAGFSTRHTAAALACAITDVAAGR